MHRVVGVLRWLARLVGRFATATERWSARRDARRAERAADAPSGRPSRLARRALVLIGVGAGSVATILVTLVLEAASPASVAPLVEKIVEDESALDVVAVSTDDSDVHPVLFPEGTDFFADMSAADYLMSDLMERGGVAVGESTWTLVLRGNRADDVTVVDMRPADVVCDAPLNGVAVDLYPQGELDKPGFLTRIDDENPAFFDLEAEYSEHGSELGLPVLDRRYFGSEYLTFAQDEEVPISVSAIALKEHCTWEIEIEYSTRGQMEVMRVAGPDGKPFEITAPLDHPGRYTAMALPYCDDGSVQVSGAEYQDDFPARCPMHDGTFMRMVPLAGSRAHTCDEQVAEALMNYARGWIGPSTVAAVVKEPEEIHEMLRWLDGRPALLSELRSGSTAGVLGNASWEGACARPRS